MISKRPKSSVPPPGTFEYVVQEKDSLRSLAAQYDVNLSLLKRVNKMMSDVIFPDQILYIPEPGYDLLNKTQDQGASKPGHVQRLGASSKDGYVAPPRPLSNIEVIKLDDECHHKFIKIKAIYCTSLEEKIPGVLLVTPDGVMFDPDASNDIVKVKGAEEFQMVDSIMSVISVTIYHDEDSLTQVLEKSAKPRTSEDESSSKVKPAEPEITTNEKLPEESKQEDNTVEQNKKELASTTSLITKIATDENNLRVYIKLKVHKNIHALKTFKFEGKIRGVTRLDHWFSIPLDSKVDQLYAFFKQWSPSMANASDSDEKNFVQIESDSPVTEVIDSSAKPSQVSPLKHKKFVKDWEIVSVKEYRRLLTVAEIKKLPLPEMSETSRILKESHVAMLACNMPAMLEGLGWHSIYSTENHGFSLNTLYRKIINIDSGMFFIIEDTSDNVFGALIVGNLKISDHFHGCGESYLFTFYPEFKRFNWTGINNYFVKCNLDCLVIGASEGNNGLWLDADLYHGRTQMCQTFDNEFLTSSEDFVVKCLEVWSFR